MIAAVWFHEITAGSKNMGAHATFESCSFRLSLASSEDRSCSCCRCCAGTAAAWHLRTALHLML